MSGINSSALAAGNPPIASNQADPNGHGQILEGPDVCWSQPMVESFIEYSPAGMEKDDFAKDTATLSASPEPSDLASPKERNPPAHALSPGASSPASKTSVHEDEEEGYACSVCGGISDVVMISKRHYASVHGEPQRECPHCHRLFSRKDVLGRHLRTCKLTRI